MSKLAIRASFPSYSSFSSGCLVMNRVSNKSMDGIRCETASDRNGILSGVAPNSELTAEYPIAKSVVTKTASWPSSAIPWGIWTPLPPAMSATSAARRPGKQSNVKKDGLVCLEANQPVGAEIVSYGRESKEGDESTEWH
jgi:hypothetical protein